jgi:hypothetical protein
VRRLLLLFAALLVAAALAPAAAANSNLLVGVDEDGFKTEPAAAARDARRLGLRAFRITLLWTSGRRVPSARETALLRRTVRTARGLRPVLAVYAQRAVDAPTTEARREQYCAFVRSALARVRGLEDVVIWNEPNKSYFWRPQFHDDGTSAAPAAYEALLARCWDALHSFRPNVRLVAPATSPRGNDEPDAVSNISHSPGAFIRKLGRAYRASGRRQPILDVVGHHAHGLTAAEAPATAHPGTAIAEGDLGKLIGELKDAFGGTGQPYPGHCAAERCVPIWFLEAGYQTIPDAAKRQLYTDSENEPRPVPDEGSGIDQAEQILAGLRLAYCQPYVEAYFNFLLWDERSLAGWQSAPFWIDRTPKGSYAAFREAIREVNERRVDCGRVKKEAPAAISTEPPPPPAPATTETAHGTSQTSTSTAPEPQGTEPSTTETATTGPLAAPNGRPNQDSGGTGWRLLIGAAVLAGAGGALALAWRRRRPQ